MKPSSASLSWPRWRPSWSWCLIVAQQEGLFQQYVEYRAIFKNVSGLKAGSEVHLAGVTVGNVLDTVINPEGNIVVTFQVIKKYSDRVRQDSRPPSASWACWGKRAWT